MLLFLFLSNSWWSKIGLSNRRQSVKIQKDSRKLTKLQQQDQERQPRRERFGTVSQWVFTSPQKKKQVDRLSKPKCLMKECPRHPAENPFRSQSRRHHELASANGKTKSLQNIFSLRYLKHPNYSNHNVYTDAKKCRERRQWERCLMYHTVSGSAVQIITGKIPIDLAAEERLQIFETELSQYEVSELA